MKGCVTVLVRGVITIPRVEFNEKVTLRKRTQEYGRGGQTVNSDKTVWGAVEDVSLSFRTKAEGSGFSPSMFVHLWRKEFETDSFTHCIVDGTEYRISMIGTSFNTMYVKLMLERG